MSERPYLSIGEVLSLLLEEFPDVSISKIRFLENQGLVEPERTSSGYRKFYEPDVERLRYILREQKDNFLPLKVIKGRLADENTGSMEIPTGSVLRGHPAAFQKLPQNPARIQAPNNSPTTPELDTKRTYTQEELVEEQGLTLELLNNLTHFGMITGRPSGNTVIYDQADVDIAQVAAQFLELGIEVRHIRSWMLAADREMALFEQRVLPLMRQRNPDSRAQCADVMGTLVSLGSQLHSVLMERAALKFLEGR